MEYTKKFSEISKESVAVAGGKGASLGEMTQARIPVPPGFVVTAQAFDEFLKITDLNVELDAILDNVDHNAMHTVDDASEKIEALITDADMPEKISAEVTATFNELGAKYVAVRSSATSEDSADAAWAGQLESYLNVTEKDFLESVQKCWASLFTPRAIFYRFEKGLHSKPISVAVVVQEMVKSEVSGIAFSVHPVTQDHDQLIIEAGFGLGEAIVQGAITPDSYVVEKSGWKILDKNITTQEKGIFRGKNGGAEWKEIPTADGEKPTLSDDEVIELSKLIVKIEKHYGFPVDIEWARESGDFYIVQSRPITTLSKKASASEPSKKFTLLWGQEQSLMLTEASIQACGVKGGLMTKDIREVLMLLDKGVGESYMTDEAINDWREGGKLYFDKKFTEELFSDIDQFITDFFKFCDDVHSQDLTKLSNHELAPIARQYWDLARQSIIYFATSSPGSTYYIEQEMGKILSAEIDDPNRVKEYMSAVSTPAELDVTMQERLDWLDLLDKEEVSDDDLESYARKYPALFFNTYDKDEVLEFLRLRIKEESKSEDGEKERSRIERTVAETAARHKEIYNELAGTELSYFASILQRGALGRYRLKHTWSGMEYLCLNFLKEIQSRFGIGFDDFIHSYFCSDVVSFLETGAKLTEEEIRNRKDYVALHFVDQELHVYSGDEGKQHKGSLSFRRDKGDASVSSEIRGDVANQGVVRGKARLVFVRDLKQFVKDSKDFRKGEILVTTMTSPVMIPIIAKAAGVITDEGGITSHAAVSSREFQIPCIVGTAGASSIIKTGDQVELDANNGVVRILKKES